MNNTTEYVTVEPRDFGHDFIRKDSLTRSRMNQVLPFQSPLSLRPRLDEALRRWAHRKVRRLAAGKAFVWSGPLVETERDVGMRQYDVYVFFEWALIPGGEDGTEHVHYSDLAKLRFLPVPNAIEVTA